MALALTKKNDQNIRKYWNPLLPLKFSKTFIIGHNVCIVQYHISSHNLSLVTLDIQKPVTWFFCKLKTLLRHSLITPMNAIFPVLVIRECINEWHCLHVWNWVCDKFMIILMTAPCCVKLSGMTTVNKRDLLWYVLYIVTERMVVFSTIFHFADILPSLLLVLVQFTIHTLTCLVLST